MKKTLLVTGIVLLSVLLAVGLIACDEVVHQEDIDFDNVSIATITIEPSSATIAKGSTQQFTAIAKDASGATISGATVEWSSTDTDVATIDTNGLATAGKPGTTAIMASSGWETYASASLTVSTATEEITDKVDEGTYTGGPIHIQYDDQFTRANGVVSGSGTEADPYIIEGWTINVSSSDVGGMATAISMYNTSRHFIIRNCHIEDPEKSGWGISLSYVANGRVEGCMVRNCWMGISLGGCSNIVISGNTIENCGKDGIRTGGSLSSEITISNNTATGCGDTGIEFNYLEDSYATGNTVTNNYGGIRVSTVFNCTISENTVQRNEGYGIEVGATFTNCTANISYNNTSNNGYGIEVRCSNNTISNNTANANQESGIFLDFVGLTDIAAGGCTISNNEANNNGANGLYIGSGCSGNTISNNTASNNVENGIEVSGGNNTISNNIFLSNSALGEYQRDLCPKCDYIGEYVYDCPNVPAGKNCFFCGDPLVRLPRYWDILIYNQPNSLGNNTYGTSCIKK